MKQIILVIIILFTYNSVKTATNPAGSYLQTHCIDCTFDNSLLECKCAKTNFDTRTINDWSLADRPTTLHDKPFTLHDTPFSISQGMGSTKYNWSKSSIKVPNKTYYTDIINHDGKLRLVQSKEQITAQTQSEKIQDLSKNASSFFIDLSVQVFANNKNLSKCSFAGSNPEIIQYFCPDSNNKQQFNALTASQALRCNNPTINSNGQIVTKQNDQEKTCSKL